MMEQERVEALKSKHRELENRIELENNRPNPDELLVTDLKRRKLKIKDELLSMHAA